MLEHVVRFSSLLRYFHVMSLTIHGQLTQVLSCMSLTIHESWSVHSIIFMYVMSLCALFMVSLLRYFRVCYIMLIMISWSLTSLWIFSLSKTLIWKVVLQNTVVNWKLWKYFGFGLNIDSSRPLLITTMWSLSKLPNPVWSKCLPWLTTTYTLF